MALAVHNADDLSSGGVGEPGVKDVCVCILAYNEQKHIADTIRAVSTGNGDAAFDIIVYANGCTDNTADVVRARMRDHPESPFARIGEGIQTERLEHGFCGK